MQLPRILIGDLLGIVMGAGLVVAIAMMSGTAGFIFGRDAKAPTTPASRSPPAAGLDDDIFLDLMKKHLATPQPGDAATRGFFADPTDVEAGGQQAGPPASAQGQTIGVADGGGFRGL